MKYFTKEWYRAALAEEQQRAAGGKLKFNKKPDNAMRDYQQERGGEHRLYVAEYVRRRSYLLEQ